MRRPHVLTSTVVAALLLTAGMLAPQPAAARESITAPHYALIDVGTLGGPQAYQNLPGVPLTSRGAVLGTADTTIPDRDFPNNNQFGFGPNPVLAHAFTWKDGSVTDLGALPGNNYSAVFQINSRGIGAGSSETEKVDPFTGWRATHAVLFNEGHVLDLGTLPGGNESFALAINDRGQAAGFASNGIIDPYGGYYFGPGWTTQARSFIWQDGVMRDIGTLGGNDAVMNTLNANGQMTGSSFTNTTPNETTGLPTLHPFLWQNGHMRDLGTLGGTYGVGNWLNDNGQVAGLSNLTGDQASHPFLWDGRRLRDLGTSDQDFGEAKYVNDAGHAVGYAAARSNQTAHAFLWKHGATIDLTGPRSAQCTVAEQINAHDEIVGHDCDESTPLLWVNGRQYDLNTLIDPSEIHLTQAIYVSDRGEIVALGNQSDRGQHLFLLKPAGWRLAMAARAARPHDKSTHHPKACFRRFHALTRIRPTGCLHLRNSVSLPPSSGPRISPGRHGAA